MGRLLTIPATGAGKAGVRKRTITRSTLSVGPVSLQLIVIIVGTLLGMFYLLQSNKLSTNSLELKALEAKKAAVVEENERLSIEAARLDSLQQIKKSTEPQTTTTARTASAENVSESSQSGTT